jgi:hypothetical protein
MAHHFLQHIWYIIKTNVKQTHMDKQLLQKKRNGNAKRMVKKVTGVELQSYIILQSK